ncbi:hypothetical protein JXJ21_21675 [candidate division KSB1 bacterium]|nr:hypothetical protein [candidate division KSB1 bacterium]
MLSLDYKIKKSNGILIIILISLLLMVVNNALAQQPVSGVQFDTHPMHWARYWARGLFDRNLIYCPIWNIGNLTDAALSPGQGMAWPGSQGNTFVGKANFYIASLVTDMSEFEGKVIPETWDGYQLPIVTDSYFYHVSVWTPPQLSVDATHQQVWAPIPGFYNDGKDGYIWGINEDVNGDGDLSPAEDINFNGILDYNLEPPLSIIKSMAISTDKRTWPEFWPGGSYINDTRPYFGRPPRTVAAGLRKGRWNGEYKDGPIADQETLYRMDDHENDRLNDYYGYEKIVGDDTIAVNAMYWPMKNPDGTPDTRDWHDDVGIAGLGIEVEGRTYGWYHPLAEDLLVSVYRVRNYSDYVLNEVITGMWCDANVGQSEYNTASYIKATYDYAGAGGRLDFDILYQWHQFPDQLSTYKKVGTFAFAFLESPGIEYNKMDDDADSLIDESMEDGLDNDGDWEPFEDIGLDKLGPGDPGYPGPDADGSEGNGVWDTEDLNMNGGMDPGEDINKNDKLDMEPINDDRGSDGRGPDENDWLGPDPDGTECNGIMDLGEPDFDLTDIDEADQAGLKIAYVYEFHKNRNLEDDKFFWNKYMIKDDWFETEETDEDIVFTFGARAVKFEKMEWKRFAIAMIMGEDQDDAIRNKATMQSIYDNNYRFLTPPLQPTLVSNVGDRVVQLYWDTDAELSKDPFFGYDFNGYRVYKSTDPKFLDIKTITDAFGNVLLFEPLAIFDKADILKGTHPVPFPTLGVHFDMGNNSGLKHSYRDTLVENGRTYYYAVTAFDAGNGPGFYREGLITEDYEIDAMPSESPFNITVNTLGEVVYRDRNTAVCIPTEPAAGYVNPFIDSSKIEHVSGFARGGTWDIQVFNKNHVKLGHVYELTFNDDHYLDNLTPDYEWGNTTGMRCMNITTGDTMFNFQFDGNFEFTQKVFAELEKNIYQGIHYTLGWKSAYTGGSEADEDRGIEMVTVNKYGRETNEWKKWATDTKSNIRVQTIELTGAAFATPFDIEFRIGDYKGVDTSYTVNPYLMPPFPLNFTTWNITDPENPRQMKVTLKYDKDQRTITAEENAEMSGQIWDSTRVTIMFPSHKEGKYNATWQVRFVKSPFDSLNPVIPPQPGDIYRFRTTRNPTRHDVYRFTVSGGEWVKENAREKMRDIYVVPDPYVVASSYEPIYELAGYQQRKVDFVNLPPKCTIKIFTASGRLVKEIAHDAAYDFGREPWDLTSEDGPEVAFGMYFFVVESKDLGITRGKFAVIK